MYNSIHLLYNGGSNMNFFERDSEKDSGKKVLRAKEIFSRKKSHCSARYGTKKPIEKVSKQELLTAWREDV